MRLSRKPRRGSGAVHCSPCRTLREPSLAILLLIVAACDGGGSGQSQPQSIAGVWTGSVTNDVYRCELIACVVDHKVTNPARALGGPDGRFHLIPREVYQLGGPQPYRQVQWVGTLQVSGNAVSGSLTSEPCLDPGHGIIRDTLIIDASVATRSTLDGGFKPERCIGGGVFNLRYDAAASPATLEAASGLWTGGDLAIGIDLAGHLVGSSSSGCQFDGTNSVIETDLYGFDITISNCPPRTDASDPPPLDGQFSGLGTILPRGTGGRTLIVSLSNAFTFAVMMVLDQ